jgi:hypothetical protein
MLSVSPFLIVCGGIKDSGSGKQTEHSLVIWPGKVHHIRIRHGDSIN